MTGAHLRGKGSFLVVKTETALAKAASVVE